MVFIGVMLAAIVAVIADLLTPRKRIQTISAIYIGLIVGHLPDRTCCRDALQPTMQLYLDPRVHTMFVTLHDDLHLLSSASRRCLQTKDDFRFIIPYVEFSKEVKGARPLVLDTSVVIDGRIADVAETRVIDQQLIIPRFVLQELQSIADSSDKLRRNRGRRGLDILNRLQKSPGIEVRIHDAEIPELAGIREVDQRLVVLAKHLGGKVVTNDYNLNKIARLQGVEVINLNDLANAMKPIVLPGEGLTVKLLKRGEEQGQGIGYLDDGTMVVAEQGAYHLGETLKLTVTSVLQTSAGRMIFGRIDAVQPAKQPVGTAGAGPHQESQAPAQAGHGMPERAGSRVSVHGSCVLGLRRQRAICRTAWRSRWAFSTRASRRKPSPVSPKARPGLTTTLASSSSFMAKSIEPICDRQGSGIGRPDEHSRLGRSRGPSPCA